MTCRECLEQFSSFSVDNLPEAGALSVREHLEACPQCRQEWQIFEHTLFVVSSSTQPLPAPQTSIAMWQRCSEHIFQQVESERLRTHQQSSGFFSWFARQPKWSWATFAGAVAVLGAAWLFAPQEEAPAVVELPNDPGALVMFQQPPAAAVGLVNHHSAMAADPFTDNVGSTLVSHSATSVSSPSRR